MVVIPILNGALGTVLKGLIKGQEELEIRGQVETIQATALLGSARILRRVLETWKTIRYKRIPEIPARRPKLVIINKKENFTIPADHRGKNFRKQKERQVLGTLPKN